MSFSLMFLCGQELESYLSCITGLGYLNTFTLFPVRVAIPWKCYCRMYIQETMYHIWITSPSSASLDKGWQGLDVISGWQAPSSTCIERGWQVLDTTYGWQVPCSVSIDRGWKGLDMIYGWQVPSLLLWSGDGSLSTHAPQKTAAW